MVSKFLIFLYVLILSCYFSSRIKSELKVSFQPFLDKGRGGGVVLLCCVYDVKNQNESHFFVVAFLLNTSPN